MKSIPLSLCILLAVTLAQPTAWTAACRAAPIPTEPVHTNAMRFRIPYQFDPAELRRLNAREIRLYVSTDQGAHWQHVQTVAPQAGRFDFRAPDEGEYWFAVRTLDAQKRLHPTASFRDPELKVVVDATPPSLELRVRQAKPGKVELIWKAKDPHLDPSTLQLEYFQSDTSRWQSVGIVPQPTGRTSWSVPSGGMVAVRGSVRDHADNTGRDGAQTEIAPADEGVPEPDLPAIREPIASTNPPLSRRFPEPPPTTREPESISEESVLSAGDWLERDAALQSAFPARQAASSSRKSGINNADALTPDEDGPSQRPPTGPQQTGSVQPGILAGPAGRTRIVDSHEFRIGYDVEGIGPSGLQSVELYITENRGKQWYQYGEDPDRKSPFEVEVPRDGTYGFSMRVRNGQGVAEKPPQPGEAPSIVVIVDHTSPEARLLPVQQGRGRLSNRLLVQWAVTDEHLVDRPVALSYSSQPDGPWEPISGWRPNTGEYVWEMSPAMPSMLYIRLTVRDAAGNVTRVKTAEPVVIDLSKPSARIVDVESLEGTPQR